MSWFYRLANKIGQHRALDLLLTAKVLNAQECVSVGLAESAVCSQEALRETAKWLSKRVPHHYSVVRAFKCVITRSETQSSDRSLEYERHTFVPFWGSQLNREALAKNIKHDSELQGTSLME